MGYVKVKKAAGAFDVVCAENVGMIKLNGSGNSATIRITYIGASTGTDLLELTSTNSGSAGGGFTQADVQAVNEAVGLIGGGSGMIDVSLSNTLASSTLG